MTNDKGKTPEIAQNMWHKLLTSGAKTGTKDGEARVFVLEKEFFAFKTGRAKKCQVEGRLAEKKTH
jgi:hypothetical protein